MRKMRSVGHLGFWENMNVVCVLVLFYLGLRNPPNKKSLLGCYFLATRANYKHYLYNFAFDTFLFCKDVYNIRRFRTRAKFQKMKIDSGYKVVAINWKLRFTKLELFRVYGVSQCYSSYASLHCQDAYMLMSVFGHKAV
eukprot:TRINITY_DN5785_c1_g2_i3.p5 TRINITY_DN5785_c1_g2~~TRINITY_DN5785_c1_g2_i3.p5  ORF type:complete len:139 (-),score=0.22 TRINITY_DN5785_c1_g2_i3:213-629(-)